MKAEEKEKMREKYNYCIRDLACALEHVNKNYIRWTIGENTHEKKESEESTESEDSDKNYCERVFAYELYHQFRKLMCENENYSCLFFNGEQQKDNSHFRNLLDVIKKQKIIPDLVLHEFIGTHENGGQVLYIEIKTIHNKDVFSDLLKLTDITKTSLNFIYYVFVYVDGTIPELIDKICGVRTERSYKELDDDIICICVKEHKSEIISIKEIKERKMEESLQQKQR